MLTLNGKVLPYDQEFQINGVVYPKNWLRNSTLLEKKAIGIDETPAPTAYDRRFYTAAGVAKPLADLKAYFVEQNKLTTRGQLAHTDWEVIKAIDPSSGVSAVAAAITTVRTDLRSASDVKEAAILACTTTQELETYLTSAAYAEWPAVE